MDAGEDGIHVGYAGLDQKFLVAGIADEYFGTALFDGIEPFFAGGEGDYCNLFAEIEEERRNLVADLA